MQPIADDFLKLISERLKLGEYAKPVCRVEVDRMVFIPGRTEQISWMIGEERSVKKVIKTEIQPVNNDITNPDYQGTTINQTAQCTFPAQGYSLANVTSEFGMRWGSMHYGIDIGCPGGTPILAAWDGTVTHVEGDPSNPGGLYINILHDQGILTRYLHNSKTLVTKGQKVVQGQVIAYSGNTGNVTGYHLHFEVHTGASGEDNWGRAEDPRPWLDGTKKMTISSNNAGTGVVDSTEITGTPGETVLYEEFVSRDWYTNTRYNVDENFKTLSFVTNRDPNSPTGIHEWKFDTEKLGAVRTVSGFNASVTMTKEGYMDIGYMSDFNSTNGNEIRIYTNGTLRRRVTSFAGNWSKEEVITTYIPQGQVDIRIEIIWGGQQSCSIALDYLKVVELNTAPDYLSGNTRTIKKLDITADKPIIETREISQLTFAQVPQTAVLQVGSFVYMDTLPLDNVISCEIDNQFDLPASEAKLTLSNPKGYYSPDYNPYYFPELGRASPWSYYMNGMQIGVLSENTPIRIYMGYGINMIRMFTGLIDKVDMDGESTMQITCRDMYKKILEKVLLRDKMYPDIRNQDADSATVPPKTFWVKSAVVQDLIAEAGMFGWRVNQDDIYYPDAVIEETYLIEQNRRTGKVIKAVPNQPMQFTEEDYADAILTPNGWMNPFAEVYGKYFPAYKYKVADAIAEVIKDINYRAYCDRYGTFRLESINFKKPVVATLTENENLMQITKTIDWSRGRSHIVVQDALGKRENFLDMEILNELKGEVRTAVYIVPWAQTYEQKKAVADKAFFDMKRLCRTLQVSIPMNPALDVLDRVMVVNKQTTTRSVYTIKGIRTSFSENGAIQVLDLMWSMDGVMI